MSGSRLASLKARLRPIALNLALVAFSFGIAALLAEVAIRVIAPQQLILIRADLWQPADTVGWLKRPGVDTRVNTGEREVGVRTDANGFRVGPDGPVNSDLEVLLLGDSFMEALQVEYEESASGLLEVSLRESLGRPVAVRNAGVGGWDPDQYLLFAKAELERHDYDLVLTSVYLGNDVIPGARPYISPREPVQRYRFRIPRGLSWTALTDAFLRPVNDFLEVRSHLFIFVRSRLQTLRMRAGLAPLTFPPQYLRSEASARSWDVTANLLGGIATLAERHGTPSLFVFVPAPFQVDSLDLQRYVAGFGLDPSSIDLEQPNRILGAALETRGLEVIDLLLPLRDAHAAGIPMYGRVDPHFSPEAHMLFVEHAASAAARLLAADQGTTSPGASR